MGVDKTPTGTYRDILRILSLYSSNSTVPSSFGGRIKINSSFAFTRVKLILVSEGKGSSASTKSWYSLLIKIAPSLLKGFETSLPSLNGSAREIKPEFVSTGP